MEVTYLEFRRRYVSVLVGILLIFCLFALASLYWGGAPFLKGGQTEVSIYNESDFIYNGSNSSNTERYRLVSSLRFNIDEPWEVEVVDGYAYLTTMGSGRPSFIVVDIRNPRAPEAVGILRTPEIRRGNGLEIDGNYAYIAAGWNADALTILDLTNRTNPVQVGSVSGPELNEANDIYVKGNFAYVTAEQADALTIVNVSNPEDPEIVSSFTHPSIRGAWEVQVAGDYAYVTSPYTHGLAVVDISDPAAPSLESNISSIQWLAGARPLAMSGQYIYVIAHNTDHNYVTKIDVGNPTDPRIVAAYDPPRISPSFEILVRNGRIIMAGDFESGHREVAAYLNDAPYAVAVANISSAQQPRLTAVRSSGESYGITIDERHMYVASYYPKALYIYRIQRGGNQTAR